MNVVDEIRRIARERPHHPAILVGARAGDASARDVAIDYASLTSRMDEIARALASAGISPGERVGLLAKQGPGFIEAALGILAADACLAPIPDGTAGEALEEAIRASALHALVDEAEGFAARRVDGASACGAAGVDGQGERAFRAIRPAYLRFTSGTTSERKGVVVGHDAVAARLANANRVLAIGPEDRVLWLLPMAHHFLVSILLYLRSGATVLLPASSFARDVLALAARATVFYASPYHYRTLASDESDTRLPAVRLAISTADGLRAEVASAFASRFGHPLVQALGIIEVGLPVVNVASAAAKPEALGRPSPGYDVWLRAEDGSRIEPSDSSPERTGEICIRGSGLFDAYLRPWMLAAKLTSPDGFRTGDQGWFDADGDLHLAGRRANRINMAGMKFFAEEVEAVLDAHPGVRASRVFAREHAQLGQIPVAEFVPEDAARAPDKRELTAHCRARLAPYKIPRDFTPVEALAMTPTGKLRRGGS